MTMNARRAPSGQALVNGDAQGVSVLSGFDPSRKDEYVGRYLREFDIQFADFPIVDLRSVLQAADAHFEMQMGEGPEQDAEEEADCWREAT